MSYQVINPFIQFVDPINGKPLSGGSVYFGRQDTDPKNQPANRINVYAVQGNGAEVLLAQPITLNGAGQPQYSGSVKQLRVDTYAGESSYCVQVFNSGGAQKGYSARVYSVIDFVSLADPSTNVVIAGVSAQNIIKRIGGYVVDQEYATLQDAIDTLKPVKLTKVHNITSEIICKSVIFSDDNNLYGISKASNSAKLNMNATGCELRNIFFDGNGASYTGGGVFIGAGSDQVINNCRIFDTVDSPIQYTAAIAGLRSRITDCDIYALNRTSVYGVSYPASETNGDRILSRINCHGGLLADFNGCSTVLVQGCNSVGAKFTGLSKKVSMVNNRWAGGSLGYDLTIRGDDHVMSGDICATNIILESDCQNTTIYAIASSFVDNSTNKKSNRIYGQKSTSVAQWLSTLTLPTIGNGSLTSSIAREGNQVMVTIRLQTGSTTTYGTGGWFFRLPYNASKNSVGSVLISNGGNYDTQSVCYLAEGNNDLFCFAQGSSNGWNASNPFTWNGDEIVTITINYEIG